MIFGRCPLKADLSEFAAGGGSARIAKHIVKCEACRRSLEGFCEDEELLSSLRKANETDDLDERTRVQILQLGLRAAREEETRD